LCHLSVVDLKPDNIFIDDCNNVKLGDFGLACHYDKHECRVLARPGTLHYSAPETFARHLHSFGFDAQSYFGAMGLEVDPATHCAILNGPELDVWGLGVVLYVMQTGKYPFWGINRDHPEDQLPTIEAILCQEQPKWPVWIEPGCADLLMRIFNKNPRQRITIVEIKQHPWVRAEMDRQMALVRETELAMLQQMQLSNNTASASLSSSTTSPTTTTTSTSSPPALVHQNSQQLLLQGLRGQLVEAKRRNKSGILPRSDTPSRTPSSCSRASSSEAESLSREPSPSTIEVIQPRANTFLRRASRTNLLRLHQYTTCLDLRQALTQNQPTTTTPAS
jgi:serine/threonine protein kinase